MVIKIVGVIALVGVCVYLCDVLYWQLVLVRSRNQGIFRDDRRANDRR